VWTASISKIKEVKEKRGDGPASCPVAFHQRRSFGRKEKRENKKKQEGKREIWLFATDEKA